MNRKEFFAWGVAAATAIMPYQVNPSGAVESPMGDAGEAIGFLMHPSASCAVVSFTSTAI